MTETRTFSFRKEPKGDLYRAVLELGVQHCPYLLLVVRDPRTLGPRGREALERLKPHLIDAQEASEWPGTVLLGDKATVYKYRTSSDLANELERLTDRLYSWIHPGLPEDLCFLRSDGTPWLVSISHERDAYFEIAQQEARTLFDLIPKLTDCVVEG